MTDELAQALMNVLDAVEAYDKEQPVQTRLSRKHDAMALAILAAKTELAVWRDHRARRLDGEASPQYVTVPDKGVTGGYRDVAIVPGWCSVLAFMPGDMAS